MNETGKHHLKSGRTGSFGAGDDEVGSGAGWRWEGNRIGRGVEGIEASHEILCVVDAEAGFAEFGDEDEGVGGGVGVGGEEFFGIVTGDVGDGKRYIRGGIGAIGKDVEKSPLGKDGEGGLRRCVFAKPREGGIECLGLEVGGSAGGIEDRGMDGMIAKGGGIEAESGGKESEKEYSGDECTVERTGAAESENDGTTEGGKGEDESIEHNGRVEEHLGDEEKGKECECRGERSRRIQNSRLRFF